MKLESSNILKSLLNFSNFEPEYPYKLYSHKNERISDVNVSLLLAGALKLLAMPKNPQNME